MNMDKMINLDDYRRQAKRRLPRFLFDFIEGGVEDEIGLQRNSNAFDCHTITPRYLVDVATRQQEATIFGTKYSSPFGISPTGMAGMYRSEIDAELAEGAAQSGVPFILSSAANGDVQKIAARREQNVWFQIYGAKNFDIIRDQLSRAHSCGVSTLVLTVDVPVSSKRERNLRNGFSRPLKYSSSMVIDALLHPTWLLQYWRSGGFPAMENWRPYAGENATADKIADLFVSETPAPGQTWEVAKRCRELWKGKFVLKGILHPDDARMARDIGADGVIVSNHGGRQLDCAPSPIDMVPEIREAVGGAMVVMMDGGVRRGWHVLLAIALGADFVFVGRPTLYAGALSGSSGVVGALRVLRKEVDTTMAQLGCAALSDIRTLRVDRRV